MSDQSNGPFRMAGAVQQLTGMTADYSLTSMPALKRERVYRLRWHAKPGL